LEYFIQPGLIKFLRKQLNKGAVMKSTEHQQSFQIIKDKTSEIREVIEGRMRSAVLDMVYEFFEGELNELCGPRYGRDRGQNCVRAGSDQGSILARGQRVQVRKPRVKHEGHDIELKTYSALQNYDMLCDRVLGHMMSGVSSRNYEPLLDEVAGGTGLKKSSVSKAFKKASQGVLDELNNRDLSKYNFSAIMIDGVGFGKRTVVAALGITNKGKKIILGLREGDTENWELCRDLFENLIGRGQNSDKAYLFVKRATSIFSPTLEETSWV